MTNITSYTLSDINKVSVSHSQSQHKIKNHGVNYPRTLSSSRNGTGAPHGYGFSSDSEDYDDYDSASGYSADDDFD